jgi:hypothetical protein
MPQDISEQETSLVTAKTPLGAFPVGSLFFTHGPLAGREIPISRETFFIGRSKGNNIPISDPSISRKHAVINFIDGKYVISDLNSLKGTYVNGKKVEEAVLRSGDIINIGESRMQFRLITPTGSWVSPGRYRYVLYIFITVAVLSILGAGGWFVFEKYYSTKLPTSVLAKIEEHYDRGIEYFNVSRDVQKAREEWMKILELDPEKKSDFAKKAARLLKSTEENTGF